MCGWLTDTTARTRSSARSTWRQPISYLLIPKLIKKHGLVSACEFFSNFLHGHRWEIGFPGVVKCEVIASMRKTSFRCASERIMCKRGVCGSSSSTVTISRFNSSGTDLKLGEHNNRFAGCHRRKENPTNPIKILERLLWGFSAFGFIWRGKNFKLHPPAAQQSNSRRKQIFIFYDEVRKRLERRTLLFRMKWAGKINFQHERVTWSRKSSGISMNSIISPSARVKAS